jgi:large subunit ribosomal protein L21
MYAVIKTGGKQYKVSENDIIRIEKIEAEPGVIVHAESVLTVQGADGKIHTGVPAVTDATVALEVLAQKRARKVIIFKKRRRKNSRRKRGYRHHYTQVRVLEILTDGKKPSKAPMGLPEKAEFTPKSSIAKTVQGDVRAFTILTAPEGAQDNLKLIGGVGPAMEKKLNEQGVYHFWQIVGMTDAEAESFDDKAG